MSAGASLPTGLAQRLLRPPTRLSPPLLTRHRRITRRRQRTVGRVTPQQALVLVHPLTQRSDLRQQPKHQLPRRLHTRQRNRLSIRHTHKRENSVRPEGILPTTPTPRERLRPKNLPSSSSRLRRGYMVHDRAHSGGRDRAVWRASAYEHLPVANARAARAQVVDQRLTDVVTLICDEDGPYDPGSINDRLLLAQRHDQRG